MNFAVMNEPRLITVTRTVTVNKRNKLRLTDKYEFITSEKELHSQYIQSGSRGPEKIR